ncbi:hypothetical protein K435DRAFT_800984 [Dendrothele bispora CBS 962.96]|uniref:Uncharacterized protein n=1 Tax=Dendrothele bispora (strain CBS 962.96) TaxID=1314807 RepID=A0A4S8LQR5_DENBC|nr:hypothetical protein K435DRAFT_800984 [Dendrothele bispora CBS 962.96]
MSSLLPFTLSVSTLVESLLNPRMIPFLMSRLPQKIPTSNPSLTELPGELLDLVCWHYLTSSILNRNSALSDVDVSLASLEPINTVIGVDSHISHDKSDGSDLSQEITSLFNKCINVRDSKGLELGKEFEALKSLPVNHRSKSMIGRISATLKGVVSTIDELPNCSSSLGTDPNSSPDNINNVSGDYHSSTTNDSSTTTNSHNVSNTTTTDSYNNIHITLNDSSQKYERRDRRNRWNVTKFITQYVPQYIPHYLPTPAISCIPNGYIYWIHRIWDGFHWLNSKWTQIGFQWFHTPYQPDVI